ncbi:dimethylsulfoniopropionate lyase (plasmid) [Rhizobium sp. YTU87027]
MPRVPTTVQRYEDLLLNDESEPAKRRVSALNRSARPRPLEIVLNAVGDMLLSAHAPVMASFVAGKVYQRLQQPGPINDGFQAGFDVGDHFTRAIDNIRTSLPHLSDAAESLAELKETLLWRSSRSGPFASLKFEQSHAHAILAGPGGLEERSDVRVGVTLMAPYSRFPDHVQFHSRVFLLLSDGEICFDLSNWFRANAGTIFFNEAGRQFAMRCTSEPLLAIWCHVEDARL